MTKNIVIGVLVVATLLFGGLYFGNSANVGASGTAHYQIESFLQGVAAGVRDQFSVDNTGNITTSGNATVAGTITGKSKVVNVSAAKTVTAAESGTIFNITTTGAVYTLPAVATAGTHYRFSVGAAFTTDAQIKAAEGDNISGTLIVAGAVVDCRDEDYINFIADGEEVGDFVDVYSNGTNWVIGASSGLTSSKITCTDPS